VQETADGHVVVIHDSDLMKIGGTNLRIGDATMADLADIDVGSWFDPRFAAERVPNLSQVLEMCRDRAGVNIELKYYGRDERLEQRVVELVEAHGMADQIVIMSLERSGVAQIRELRPDWTVGLLAAVTVGDLTRVDVDFLAVSAKMATPGFVRHAHLAGKSVHVWTINDSVTMSNMLGRGVDSVITDEPALLRSVIAARAEMEPTERLLLVLGRVFGSKTEGDLIQ